MKTIYKYELPITDAPVVYMPEGAQILSAAATGTDDLLIWAIVDPGAPTEQRRLALRGTGHPLNEVGPFIATIQDRQFVWHLFEAATPITTPKEIQP